MKTLRVTLADIIGPTGTPNSTATVHARYVDTAGRGRDVHLTDGTIVVPVRRVAAADGDPEVFDFDVYANDAAPVREVDYGHLVEVSWTVVAPTGAKSSGVKRVQITDDMDAVVQLGLLVTPDPIPGLTGGYVTPETYATLVERMDVFEEGGPVWSVNGENGVVTLDAADVGAAADDDPRLSDSRTPNAHAASHATGGADPITPAGIGAVSEFQGLADYRTAVGTSRNVVTTPRALISVIDDDGDNELLSNLAPIMQARNLPLGVALMSTSEVWTNPASRATLKGLQDNNGWEILSHTMTHMDIDLSTRAAYEADCQAFLDMARGEGFHVTNIAYPWGKENATTKTDITPRYFLGGFNVSSSTGPGTSNAVETMDPYAIFRQGLGSYSDLSLSGHQALIDGAIANNKWIVYMTHAGGTDAAGLQLIEDVLDYAIAQGVAIVTPRDGLREFGPVTASGRMGLGDHVHLKPNGVINSSRYFLVEKKTDNYKNDAAPPEGGTGLYEIVWRVTGWPVRGTGVVREYSALGTWARQEFTGVLGDFWVRRWTGSAWAAWESVLTSASSQIVAPIRKSDNFKNEAAAAETPTTTMQQILWVVSGWSVGSGYVTEYVYASGWQRQELRRSGVGGPIYVRSWTGSAWSGWTEVSRVGVTGTFTVTARTIPAQSTVDIALSPTSTGYRTDRLYLARPNGPLEAGLTWSVWCHAAGTIVLRLANATSSSVSIAERVWYVRPFVANDE